MSPVGVNTQIVSHSENGFLPIKLEDWRVQLETLLLDVDLRNKIGEAGKKTIDERYSVLSNQSNYLSLFQ